MIFGNAPSSSTRPTRARSRSTGSTGAVERGVRARRDPVPPLAPVTSAGIASATSARRRSTAMAADPARRARPAGREGGSRRWRPCCRARSSVAANVYLIARQPRSPSWPTSPRRRRARTRSCSAATCSRRGIPRGSWRERLEMARQLYRAGLARRIIVSGAATPDTTSPTPWPAGSSRRGVAPADVVIHRGGYRTAASMADAAAHGPTCWCVAGYHLPRAVYLASRAGLAAIGVAARAACRLGARPASSTFVRETTARAEIDRRGRAAGRARAPRRADSPGAGSAEPIGLRAGSPIANRAPLG